MSAKALPIVLTTELIRLHPYVWVHKWKESKGAYILKNGKRNIDVNNNP
jgi:hypothetical protein